MFESVPGYSQILLIAFYLFLLFAGSILWCLNYLAFGIGLYTMAEGKKLRRPWLAFVPVGRKYIQGELAGRITIQGRRINNPGIWLAAVPAGIKLLAVAAGGVGLAAVMTVKRFWPEAAAGEVFFSVLQLFLLWFMVLVWVVSGIMGKCFTAAADYQIYSQGAAGTVHAVRAVLSVLVPFYQSIYFFSIRSKSFTNYD